jgi:hypothetical protein
MLKIGEVHTKVAKYDILIPYHIILVVLAVIAVIKFL